jgi:hypothetical protein
VFAPLGVIFGVLGKRRQERLAQRAIIVSIVAGPVGFLIGFVLGLTVFS